MGWRIFLRYLAVLSINATAAGCTFGWFAFENSATRHDWGSARFMSAAYVTGLLTFTIGGLLMSLLLARRLEVSLGLVYAFLVMFSGELIGIACLILGVRLFPPFILLGQVILNFFCVGSYTLSYRLEDKLSRIRVSVTIGFAISILVYQLTQIPIAPELSLGCWLILHGVAAGFFLLTMWRIEIAPVLPSKLCQQLKLVLHRGLVWISAVLVLIVILNQSYYFQTFNQRIDIFTVDKQQILVIVLSAAQALSSLAGLITALPLAPAAVISTFLLSISGLSLCFPSTFLSTAIMMGPMTLGATGALSSAMGILYLETRCVEATALCYAGMVLGNVLGYVLSAFYRAFSWIDCLVGAITPLSALCAVGLIPLQRLPKVEQNFEEDSKNDVEDLMDYKNNDSSSVSVDKSSQP
ncbi:hypothetical protein GL50803_00101330 [Giardia duodenalis]|uniref:Uncharacterized protein n=1 Tax=Giardia intestinalis (strain ATCC 50803 / WB clone C6) TaxID=184922 RepID=A8BWN9_GIAIC|nr:hypothetical protein GL50803_00101330 [Giardia intestinalis]KAE8304078.1 hypothetical protein GL50803_00101330 [Giardia intestinalis]|eukprot:XP_001704448.1 Hypothetical protein GL50803_101330 [Giardia lamblia ATCC 50803]